MITQENSNITINILMHIFILFSFLSIFFLTYGSKIEEKTITKELNSNVEEQTYAFLDTINSLYQKNNLINYNVDWATMKKVANKIKESSQKATPEIELNNYKVRSYTIIICVILLCSIFSVIIYVKLYKGVKTNLKTILVENIIIFIAVALMEYYFFTNIITKYIPVDPIFVQNSILEKIQSNLNSYITK